MPDFHSKRCFVAIVPDDVVRADLADLLETIQIDGMRKVRAENLHFTVKFLGNVFDPAIPEVIAGLEEALRGASRFDMNVTGVALFPSERRPRVLAAILNEPAELTLAAELVEDAMYEQGFAREGRPLNPHITLGRFRRPPRRTPSLDEIDLPDTGFTADRLVLMQSDLAAGGPTYTPLASIMLGE